MDIKLITNGNYAIRPRDEAERRALIEACVEAVFHLAQMREKEPEFFERVMLPLANVAIQAGTEALTSDSDRRRVLGRKKPLEDSGPETLEVDKLTLKNIGYALKRFDGAEDELVALCARLDLEGDSNSPIMERLQHCISASRMLRQVANVVQLEN